MKEKLTTSRHIFGEIISKYLLGLGNFICNHFTGIVSFSCIKAYHHHFHFTFKKVLAKLWGGYD